MKDLIDVAIMDVNQDFHCTEDTFIVLEELKSSMPGKLLEGINIKENQTNFTDCFVMKE